MPPDPRRLVLATRNPHKIGELKALLRDTPAAAARIEPSPEGLDVEEDGDTLEANAIKKAVTVARALGAWAMADDSGLEVEALRGAPGVRSARYAGEPADDARNNRKLLAEMEGMGDRRARFRCVLALSSPGGGVETVEGRCEGLLAASPRGTGGFGYDPLFVPLGAAASFAEMDPGEKNRISHRGRALRAAARRWFHNGFPPPGFPAPPQGGASVGVNRISRERDDPDAPDPRRNRE